MSDPPRVKLNQRWIRIAGECLCERYRVDRAVLEQLVANFTCDDPVPIIVGHVLDNAIGWVNEIEVRVADGKAQLWALALLVNDLRPGWLSIGFVVDAKDRSTGSQLGNVLAHVAYVDSEGAMEDFAPWPMPPLPEIA